MTSEPTVFVVDDDQAVLRSFCALLQSRGYRTAAFVSAEDFLSAYQPAQPGCLITDLRMTGISGFDLQQQLRELASPLPVIVVTGHADVAIAVRIMAHGAVTLLEKPVEKTTLLHWVDSALRRNAARRARQQQMEDVAQRLVTLSEDEIEVMQRMIKGVPNGVIARETQISLRTCDRRRRSILSKMGVQSLPELAALLAQYDAQLQEMPLGRGHDSN